MTGCPAEIPRGNAPDYVSYASAATAMAANLGVPKAREAYQKIHRMAPWLAQQLAADPSWAIAPWPEAGR